MFGCGNGGSVPSLRYICGWAPRPARWRSNSVSKPVRLVRFCHLAGCSQVHARVLMPCPLLGRFTSSTCAPKMRNAPENCGWSERETSPTASHDASTPGALSKHPPLKPAPHSTRCSPICRHVILRNRPLNPSCYTTTTPPPQKQNWPECCCYVKVEKYLWRLKEKCTEGS